MINLIWFKEWIKKVKNNYGVTWNDIHKAIVDGYIFNSYNSTYEKIAGDIFEYICKYILLQTYEEVYLNKEIPNDIRKNLNMNTIDNGIDGIYKKNNVFYSFQCKWRGNQNNQLKKAYITEFRHEYQENSLIKNGLMMTNVKKSTNGFTKFKDLKWFINVNLCDEIDQNKFIKFVIKSIENKKNVMSENKFTKYKLRDYQETGIKNLLKINDDRITCIMACGTGKTIMMFEYYKRYKNNKKVLFLFPSLQLLSQTYKKFKQLNSKINTLCVCSQLDKMNLGGGDVITNSEADALFNEYMSSYNIEFTTDKKIIDKHVSKQNEVIFCTYHSVPLVKNFTFDLAFFDEAHKTVNNRLFDFAIYNKNCKIKQRLFFTATPKYYTGVQNQVYGMNNIKLYGNIGYKYYFSNAIADKYILDYNIGYYTSDPAYIKIVEEKYLTELRNEDEDIETNTFISAYMIKQFIEKVKLKRYNILTYHNTIKNSEKFAKYLKFIFNDTNINGCIQTISGKNSMSLRKEKINEFRKANISVLCSSKVLNEGIDIPCVNVVVFVEPRKSTIDIVQCIGRGMRLYKDDNKCNVLIPIHSKEGINKYGFDNIQEVLNAMGTVDEKLVEYFVVKNKRTTKVTNYGNIIIDRTLTKKINPKFSVEEIEKALKLKIINKNEYCWEYTKNLLFEYCNKHKKIPLDEISNRINIGEWLSIQKNEINNEQHDIYIKMSKNIYVKAFLDTCLKIRKKYNNNMLKDYNCELCNYFSYRKSDYTRHLNTTKHIDTMKKIILEWQQPEQQAIHTEQLDKNEQQLKQQINQSTKYRATCQYCNNKLSHIKSIKRHYKSCKKKLEFDITTNTDTIIKNLTEKNKKLENDKNNLISTVNKLKKTILSLELTKKKEFDNINNESVLKFIKELMINKNN